MKNYLKQSDKRLFYDLYAYVDTTQYLADNIFIQEKIRVRFDGELRNPDNQYGIVLYRLLSTIGRTFKIYYRMTLDETSARAYRESRGQYLRHKQWEDISVNVYVI